MNFVILQKPQQFDLAFALGILESIGFRDSQSYFAQGQVLIQRHSNSPPCTYSTIATLETPALVSAGWCLSDTTILIVSRPGAPVALGVVSRTRKV
jgi:hypothetical protein